MDHPIEYCSRIVYSAVLALLTLLARAEVMEVFKGMRRGKNK